MTEDGLTAYFNAAAAAVGLAPRPEHREEVFAAFRVLMEQAKLVTEFALPDETEAAPRFSP